MIEIKPKIALIGYGAMGKEIEKIAQKDEFEITDIFEIDSKISERKKYGFDVAIDFGFSDFVPENVEILSKMGKNIVIGTTGWYKEMDDVISLVQNNNIGCIYGSNFSVGVQMFQRIVNHSAKLLNKVAGYDIMIHELHHKRKRDSPSGTALTLANTILENIDIKEEILTEKCSDKISPEQLHVSSTRGGEVTGTHIIYIDSFSDSIELIHRAKNRSAFAEGALAAARWIYGKKGFYQFNDMLSDLWKDINA